MMQSCIIKKVYPFNGMYHKNQKMKSHRNVKYVVSTSAKYTKHIYIYRERERIVIIHHCDDNRDGTLFS